MYNSFYETKRSQADNNQKHKCYHLQSMMASFFFKPCVIEQ